MCKKVMVIEDQPYISRLIEILLKNEGFNVIVINDSKIAFYKAIEEKPDIIILDVLMPNIHGLELFSMFRNSPETAKIPIIFTTVLDESELVPPANGYISKPFTRRDLVNAIKKIHLRS